MTNQGATCCSYLKPFSNLERNSSSSSTPKMIYECQLNFKARLHLACLEFSREHDWIECRSVRFSQGLYVVPTQRAYCLGRISWWKPFLKNHRGSLSSNLSFFIRLKRCSRVSYMIFSCTVKLTGAGCLCGVGSLINGRPSSLLSVVRLE